MCSCKSRLRALLWSTWGSCQVCACMQHPKTAFASTCWGCHGFGGSGCLAVFLVSLSRPSSRPSHCRCALAAAPDNLKGDVLSSCCRCAPAGCTLHGFSMSYRAQVRSSAGVRPVGCTLKVCLIVLYPCVGPGWLVYAQFRLVCA